MATQSSEPSEVIDSSSYQTFLTVRCDGDLIYRVEEQLESWLRNRKGWDAPTEQSGFHVGPKGEELLILRPEDRVERTFRARLVETAGDETWRTTLTVHEPREGDAWLGLRVANSHRRFAAVPHLATYLLEALEARDGEVWLAPEPRLVHTPGVEDLMSQVCDDTRQGLFFVAGTGHSTDMKAYQAKVSSWSRQVHGLAEVALLDPPATRAFNRGMGETHGVTPGTIRTFLPNVDPAISSDSFRHKYLTASRLTRESEPAIRSLLGRISRRHASIQPAPREFQRVDRALARLEDRLLVDRLSGRADESGPPLDTLSEVITETPPPPAPSADVHQRRIPRLRRERVPDEATHLAAIERVRLMLGISELTDKALGDVADLARMGRASQASIQRVARQLDDKQARVDELTEIADFYRELYDDEQQDAMIALDEVSRLADEVRWLRSRLAAREDHAAAYSMVPDDALTHYPANFADLRDRLTELEVDDVVFTGDEKETLALDEHDTLYKLVRTTWEALLVLTDYIRARSDGRCDKGVRHYLEHTPPGLRSLPPNKYAAKETGPTMAQWGDLREFPVPLEVSSSGFARMEAHFKLGRVGMVSPRMYYLDDWASTGKVYVGYIGAHLRNTQTN
jgi:hypothetical protein